MGETATLLIHFLIYGKQLDAATVVVYIVDALFMLRVYCYGGRETKNIYIYIYIFFVCVCVGGGGDTLSNSGSMDSEAVSHSHSQGGRCGGGGI